jgi:UDP-N-acetylglucosamine 2-epimerase
VLPPLGYRDMLALQMNALFVITDSGGVQVETTVLRIPCLTVMDHPYGISPIKKAQIPLFAAIAPA